MADLIFTIIRLDYSNEQLITLKTQTLNVTVNPWWLRINMNSSGLNIVAYFSFEPYQEGRVLTLRVLTL